MGTKKTKLNSQGDNRGLAKTAYPSEEPILSVRGTRLSVTGTHFIRQRNPNLSVTGTQIKIDRGGAGQFYRLKIMDLLVKNKGFIG